MIFPNSTGFYLSIAGLAHLAGSPAPMGAGISKVHVYRLQEAAYDLCRLIYLIKKWVVLESRHPEITCYERA
jgi:hypothetical protein